MRVLIVDDDDANRLTLAALLEDEGCEVVEAVSVAGVRDLFVTGPAPAVVVLDLGLPDGSGLGLVPEVRAAWPEARVMILSGAQTQPVDGVSAVLSKGGDPSTTLRKIIG